MANKDCRSSVGSSYGAENYRLAISDLCNNICQEEILRARSRTRAYVATLIELKPGRLRELDVRGDLIGNHGIEFLRGKGHRLDTLLGEFCLHGGQRQRLLYLGVQSFDD